MRIGGFIKNWLERQQRRSPDKLLLLFTWVSEFLESLTIMNRVWLLIALVSAVVVEMQGWEQYDKCDMDFEKVGCFNDNGKNRALPKELLNERDSTNPDFDGHELDWKNFKGYISGLACRCAAKSRELGYEIFGLQFFAECWSGNGKYDKYGKATAKEKCYKDASLDANVRNCVDSNDEVCVGSQFTNYVYRLTEKSVDGGYTNWGDWSTCSTSCGGGVQHRERTCTNPTPAGKGKDCSGLGPAEESKECENEPCIPDVDGGYTNWGDWSTCTKSCGGGTQHRERTCTNPRPTGNGRDCSGLGPAEESKECAKEPCIPDVDGGYTNWGDWSTCTKSCGGGTQHRERTCTNPKPSGKGKDCSSLGPAEESKECAKEPCIPDTDGGYSNWGDWSTCTKSCGGGTQHRERTCTNPKPSGKGKDCSGLGSAEESKECAKEPCIPDTDGGYTNWGDWSACTESCGGGAQHRERTCTNPTPSGKGKDCSSLGPNEETQQCGTVPCPHPETPPPPVCNKKLDVGFVVDASRSIGKSNFKKVQDSLKDLVDYLKVSPQGSHVGITLYSTTVRIKHMLNDDQNPSKIKEVIDNFNYDRGQTWTDAALAKTATVMFKSGNGIRTGVPSLVIVFTDGGNTKGIGKLRKVMNKYYKNTPLNTIAVGIGNRIRRNQLLVIAQGHQNDVIYAKDFDVLKEKLGDIVKQACEE